MKREMIVMVGLPRSGKSTYVDKHFSNYQIICPDEIRLALGIQFEPKIESFVWAIHDTILRASLQKGYSVCIDATNTKKESLLKYQNISKKYEYEMIIFAMDTPMNVCLERNNGPGSVPNVVIERMDGQLKYLDLKDNFFGQKVIHVK